MSLTLVTEGGGDEGGGDECGKDGGRTTIIERS